MNRERGPEAGSRVLVIASLTPSVVAGLPVRVVGIVAASDRAAPSGGGEHASHPVILARGRGIPLAFVAASVVRAIADDDVLALDMTGGGGLPLGDAGSGDPRRRSEAARGMAARARSGGGHGGRSARVPGARGAGQHRPVHERVAASAEGIGLVRTELVFSGHTGAPSQMEQFAALRVIAASAGDAPVVVRLFDAGGDKPLSWLQAPHSSPSANVSGQDRADTPLSLDARALRMIERVVTAAHAQDRKLSVCGEMAGDPHGARILVGLGVDAISVATARFAKVKLALHDVTREDCRGVAPGGAETGGDRGLRRSSGPADLGVCRANAQQTPS